MKFSGNFVLTGNYSAGGSSSASAFTGTLLHTLSEPTGRFGESVGISGDNLIVGAYQDSISSGKAYIYNVITGNLLHTLNNPNAYQTENDDQFGRAVAISANYAVVGAWGEDSASGADSGVAYIFDVATGNLLHTLTNPNAYSTSSGDLFGLSVAISDSYAIVGAYREDDASGNNSGAAYIYDVTTGNLLHTLTNPNAYSTGAGDRFGYSVSISSNRIIVGASQEDDAGGRTAGAAYIFDAETGTLLHTLTNPNAYSTSANDSFGYSVSISGNQAIVGAVGEKDETGNTYSGAAYIFDVSTGNLLQTLINPNVFGTALSDEFAFSVAISGDRAVVSARQEDDGGTYGAGVAYIFDTNTGSLLHTLRDPTPTTNGLYGYSVAISNQHALVARPIGAKVYVYN